MKLDAAKVDALADAVASLASRLDAHGKHRAARRAKGKVRAAERGDESPKKSQTEKQLHWHQEQARKAKKGSAEQKHHEESEHRLRAQLQREAKPDAHGTHRPARKAKVLRTKAERGDAAPTPKDKARYAELLHMKWGHKSTEKPGPWSKANQAELNKLKAMGIDLGGGNYTNREDATNEPKRADARNLRELGQEGKYPLTSRYTPKVGDYIDYFDKNGDKQYGQVSAYDGKTITVNRKKLVVQRVDAEGKAKANAG